VTNRKHGIYRPALEGMIKTNKAPVVRKTTAAAFAAFPNVEPVLDSSSEENENSSSLNEAFPKSSLDILTAPLRAVGPATASLVLNVATEGNPNEVPFYSDELYLWLCLGKYPLCGKGGRKKAGKRIRSNGELDVKYNLREYRDLWEAVLKLRNRLNGGVKTDDTDDGSKEEETEGKDTRVFTAADIERVAYVLKELDVSGFPGASEILEQDAREQKEFEEEEKEEEQEILGVKREAKKRKREEEEELKEKTKQEEEEGEVAKQETEDYIPLGGDEEEEEPKQKKRKKNEVKEKSSPRKGKIKGKKMKKMQPKRGKTKK
jgi:hypothetical protein